MMIARLRASKQHNLRPISMSAKSKYFAKLRSEVLRVKSDKRRPKNRIVTPASETCKEMPQEGGTKVVLMSSIGIVRAVY